MLMLTEPRVGSSLGVLLDPVLPRLQALLQGLSLPELIVEAEVLAAAEAGQAARRDDPRVGLGILEQGQESGRGLQRAGFGDDLDRRRAAGGLGAVGRPG